MMRARAKLMLATALAAAPMGQVLAQAVPNDPAGVEPVAADENRLPTDIIVTARKVTERLQDAPVSVTAFTDEVISQRDIRDVSDLARFTPGLSFSQTFGRTTDRPVIRGLSNVLAGVQFGVESGTAYFVDGVYYSGDIQALNLDAVERVEVIKGPQSALYGRNTYAGAINFITKSPGDRFQGIARARALTDEEFELSASVDVPVAPDFLSLRLDGRYYTYGGEYKNQITGKTIGDEESASAAVTAFFEPGTDWDIRLRAQYSKDDDGPIPFFLQGADQNNCAPGFRSPAFRTGGTLTSSNRNQYFCGVIKPRPDLVALNTDATATSADGTAFDGSEVERFLTTLSADWDINDTDFVLTLLGGYRWENRLFGSDSDFSPAFIRFGPPTTEPLFANTNRDTVEDYSVEARIATPQEAPIRGLAGIFYYDQEIVGRDLTFANPRRGEPFGSPLSDRSTVENWSVFGRVEVDLLENLTLAGELRYLEETKTLLDFGGTAATTDNFQGRYKTDDIIPRVTLDYKYSPDGLLYAIYAEGNKPGGLNGSAGVTIARPTYADETLKGGEIGIKQSFMDRRLTTNLSVFYNDIASQQLTTSVPNPGGQGALTSIVTNQGNAEVKGLEIDLQAAITDEFFVSGGYAYVNAKFTSGCDDFEYTLNTGGLKPNFNTENPPPSELPLCTIDGRRLPLGSPHQIFGALNYETEMRSGLRFFANTNFSFEDSKFVQVHNRAETGETFLLGARIGVGGENWEVAFIGRNLTDEDTIPLATRWFDLRYGFAPRVGGPNGIPPSQIARADTGLPRAFFASLRRGRQLGIELKFNY